MAKKISTRHRHKAAVVNAMNLIWHNPNKELNLEYLSNACNISKYHFHRIFNEQQGETLNSYIARKRIEHAANNLILFPYYSISRIASSLGFSSPANFSKAFKRQYGITAREYRHPEQIDSIADNELNSKYGKVARPDLHYSKYQFLESEVQQRRIAEMDQTISLVNLSEQTLIYRTVNDGFNITSWLPAWNKIYEWAEGNFQDWQSNLFGVWYDNINVCPNNLLRQDMAIRVPATFEAPPSFMRQKISSGVYATGIIQGDQSQLYNYARDIYMFWLVKRGLIADNRPYYLHYLNDATEDGYYRVRFFIKVTSRCPVN